VVTPVEGEHVDILIVGLTEDHPLTGHSKDTLEATSLSGDQVVDQFHHIVATVPIPGSPAGSIATHHHVV